MSFLFYDKVSSHSSMIDSISEMSWSHNHEPCHLLIYGGEYWNQDNGDDWNQDLPSGFKENTVWTFTSWLLRSSFIKQIGQFQTDFIYGEFLFSFQYNNENATLLNYLQSALSLLIRKMLGVSPLMGIQRKTHKQGSGQTVPQWRMLHITM